MEKITYHGAHPANHPVYKQGWTIFIPNAQTGLDRLIANAPEPKVTTAKQRRKAKGETPPPQK